MATAKSIWYRGIWWLMLRLYYCGVRILRVEADAPKAALLYVGLHRNGGIDVLAYNAALKRHVNFLVSSQWRRGFFRRLLIDGIFITRQKDGSDRSGNDQALATAATKLTSGQAVFVLPEGTSDLGPRPLPIKYGAARIAHLVLFQGTPLTIVPASISYDDATAYGSQIELRFGPALRLNPGASIDEIHRLIERHLLALAPGFCNAQAQASGEMLAAIRNDRPRHLSLQSYAGGLSQTITAKLDALRHEAKSHRLLHWHGAPIASCGNSTLVAGLLVLTLTVPLLAINAPALLVAYIGGRYLADARNVIVLWRILIGLPALLLWWSALVVLAWPLAIAAVAAALIAPRIIDRGWRWLVAGINGWRSPTAAALCSEMAGTS